MWLLDKFLSPTWYKASRLDKSRRRTVATTLCGYDFLRQQAEKKLLGPVERYLLESSGSSDSAAAELPVIRRIQLVDEALMALLWSCTCPAFDPALNLPRNVVPHLPEVWGGFVLSDVNNRLNRSTPTSLDQTGYSEDSEEAHRQVLQRWKEILDLADPEFEGRVNAGGFGEAWEWLSQMFVADTLVGMAAIPDRVLFSQARRLADATPPHRAPLVERFIQQIAAAPGK